MCRKCYKKFKPKGLIWSVISCVIAFILCGTDIVLAIRKGNLLVPTTYTSGNGDLHVQLHSFSPQLPPPATTKLTDVSNVNSSQLDLRLQVTRIEDSTRLTVAIIDVLPDPRVNITQITIDCHYLLYGGLYELEIVGNDIHSSVDNQDERLRQQLDIRWPVPKLSVTPESIGTYPQQPVDVILEFPGVECGMSNSQQVKHMPGFWLELYYCGHEVYCDSTNLTSSQVLYAEQVTGYPKVRLVKLRCDLFGLAGHYIVKLKPTSPILASVSATAYIKADWSEEFVFNVHARSITPCDPHTGIGVLFEYPACILEHADRVRLFAKLRADVASLAPPTSLHYVTEQRVIRGQHSLHFDCDFFSEKFIEYCFVYVSQAISGAVADIRMDCLPTLPVSDLDVGGWGPWSDWTPCSTTCAGGTRNRYRVCDSPPPRYGAKFCQGAAVETEQCGGPVSGTWECMYGNGNFFGGELPADRPEVKAEIGPGCRCGCIVHLSVAKPKRLIASSAESCPGRTFWLIQADDEYRISFNIDFFRLICQSQYLRIRDGDSLASELIAEYIGGGGDDTKKTIVSTESQVLIEFYSNELSTIGESCKGGFLTHAQQISPNRLNVSISVTSKAIMPIAISPIAMKLTLVHIMAILFASIIIVVSALLGAQYIFRYRKYQLAESMGEPDSPAHTPRASIGSIQAPASRAASTSTLLSEVVSLVKLRPRCVGRKLKHSRLRESIDGEALENGDADHCYNQKSQSDEDDLSIESSHTLTNETFNDLNNPENNSKKDNAKSLQITKTHDEEQSSSAESSSPGGGGTGGSESVGDGSCSPPSNNSISLPPTPRDTPIPLRKFPKNKNPKLCRRNAGNAIRSNDLAETKSMNGKSRRKNMGDVSPVREEESSAIDTETDTDSIGIRIRRHKKLSVSNVTLTNGCYSPALSMVSRATIRTNNIKESKEKKNREKLLAGPGSEFSLANPEDFELDYYDYNVTNAGAAPGSYLGMDPQYLVWIPPLDDGDIINEIDGDEDSAEEPHYEEILPRFQRHTDPGSSTTETPSEEEAPNLPPLNQKNKEDSKNWKNSELSKIIAANTLCEAERSEIGSTTKLNQSRRSSSSSIKKNSKLLDSIQMQEFPITKKQIQKISSPIRVHQSNRRKSTEGTEEKETTVVKSPSDKNNDRNCGDSVNSDYYELDDIQFVDDEEDSSCLQYISKGGGVGGGGASSKIGRHVDSDDGDNKDKFSQCDKQSYGKVK